MKPLYYFLNFTWGILINIVGAIAAGALYLIGKKPIRHAGSIVFRVGHNWGGLNLGIFSIVSEEAGEHTLNHEFGHSLQNCLWGPLFPFVVSIPSARRYWKFIDNEKKGIPNEDYDAVWYEGQATKWGTEFAKKW